MKKKILSFLCALCLVISCAFLIAACGGSKCEHKWNITRQPSMQETGAVACSECGQDGFELPKLNDTDYEVEGTNPDYKIYKYTKDGKTYEAIYNNFEVLFNGIDGYTIVDYHGNSANIVIPERINDIKGEQSVIVISDEAFKDDTNITSVTLPDTIFNIGNGAFRGCTNLASITLPEGLSFIGNYAFADTALTSVVIPSGVSTIGAYSFEGCDNLQEITVPFVGTSCGMQSRFGAIFGDANSNTVVPSSLKKVTVTGSENESTAFHWSVFEDCASIEEVIIGDNVSTLGNRAFYNCTSLKKIVLGSSIETFSSDTFYNCTSLGEVVFSSSFEALYGSSFTNCESLTEIVIPQSVTFIHGNAFNGGTALEKIYYMGTKSQWNNVEIPNYDEYGLQDVDVYYYSETQPTGLDYLNNDCELNMWHYDNENNKVLWTINETNNVDGKTYVYSHSEVDLSDEYWYALQAAKSMGMIEDMFAIGPNGEIDQEGLEMFTSSATKEEYEGKLAIYYASTAVNLSVSFRNNMVVLEQVNDSAVFDYIEVDGEIYYILLKTKAFICDTTNNTIYEEMASEYFNIKHIYNLDN